MLLYNNTIYSHKDKNYKIYNTYLGIIFPESQPYLHVTPLLSYKTRASNNKTASNTSYLTCFKHQNSAEMQKWSLLLFCHARVYAAISTKE